MNVVAYFCHVQGHIRMCIPSKYMLNYFYWSRIFTEVSVCLSQKAALSSMGCVGREILFLTKIWKLNFTLGCFYLCIPCLLLKYFLVFGLFLLVGDLECSPWIIAWHCHRGVSCTGSSSSSLFECQVQTLPVVAEAVCQTWSGNELGKFSEGAQCSENQVHLWVLNKNFGKHPFEQLVLICCPCQSWRCRTWCVEQWEFSVTAAIGF